VQITFAQCSIVFARFTKLFDCLQTLRVDNIEILAEWELWHFCFPIFWLKYTGFTFMVIFVEIYSVYFYAHFRLNIQGSLLCSFSLKYTGFTFILILDKKLKEK
jgi:hypothetical protein